MLPYTEQSFFYVFTFNSSSLEQHRISDVFCRALVYLMREAMKNIFQCIHHSAALVLRREDRHPGATFYNPCLLPGSSRAAARHAGKEGGCHGAARWGMAGAPLGSCRVLACTGVSLVQSVCQSLTSWGTQVSTLCLTHSDRDLPTRLFLPRSNFRCSIPLPSTAQPLKSRAGYSVWVQIWVGRINSNSFYFCCADWGCSQRPISANGFPEAMVVTDRRRQKALEASDLFWEACWDFLLWFCSILFFFLKICLHLSQRDCKYLSLFLTMCILKTEAN